MVFILVGNSHEAVRLLATQGVAHLHLSSLWRIFAQKVKCKIFNI